MDEKLPSPQSPWGKVPRVESVNLLDIMSEELAKQLQDKEIDLPSAVTDDIMLHTNEEVNLDSANAVDGDSDAVIAHILQKQFDKEYDEYLTLSEKKFNGDSKVSVSFDNYRRTTASDSDDEDEVETITEKKDWDRFDSLHREMASMPAKGYCVKNGSVVTKHDKTINGRQNACKMLSFPPEFHTGDGETFDMQLPNNVFNSLKTYSRRHRAHDRREGRITANFSLDERTRLIIYKLINKETLESVSGVISIGKEAVVLQGERADGQYCAIKVFKTTLAEFKQRDKYIKGDHRFNDRLGNQSASKTVHLWAEKETRNLNRLHHALIPGPHVITLVHHVLVMELIGKKGKPAPKLKDACLEFEDYVIAYEQIVTIMKRLYKDAKLVHADLSEYNILWHDNQCYLIDLSQSLEVEHENADFFLLRDCKNISTYFGKKKIPDVESPEELFKSITDIDYSEKLKHLTLSEPTKLKPHMLNNLEDGVSSTDYNFDEAWQKTQQEKSETKFSSNECLVDLVPA